MLTSQRFQRIDSLEYLNLHDNALTSLPEGVFSGLSSLTDLYENTLPEGCSAD